MKNILAFIVALMVLMSVSVVADGYSTDKNINLDAIGLSEKTEVIKNIQLEKVEPPIPMYNDLIAMGSLLETVALDPIIDIPEQVYYEEVEYEEPEYVDVVEETVIAEEETEDLPEETAVLEETEEPESNDIWLTDSEMDFIAQVTYCEAGNESEYGQRLVIDTILNRVDSSSFPDSVDGVLWQSGQFTTVLSGWADSVPVYDDIRELVEEEAQNRTNYDVAYFNAVGFPSYGTDLFQEGGHYFAGE